MVLLGLGIEEQGEMGDGLTIRLVKMTKKANLVPQLRTLNRIHPIRDGHLGLASRLDLSKPQHLNA